MIVKVIFVVLLLVLNPWAAIGQPKGESGVRGEIVGQGGLKFPIAVSPLKNLGALPTLQNCLKGLPTQSFMTSICRVGLRC